mmetsp:Transcript_27863/g.50366  ORF Transcript_27863/g.50366 Transcript_27863/m.50366 type:complete len:572 (-) Transcript_27863:21-1736(-)|eukprot:CAMPEP_0197621750 /NCGR_PEP_ID=MMETSP1338-20131121/2228_1 /TAXON_ID=43686 ORGANISM="Pelagodinium beii, Strain RCC1491" /NCGR_SAMPLE_ID=MMETSP1338 /ASSEMBLY_ACC=CAM_ASM_000754 /LENGTH=571 /DNA_ID=CAMNT_0043191287 /DNA_START=93 /DNA_END=1808 /DNA_ORIENTATION=-
MSAKDETAAEAGSVAKAEHPESASPETFPGTSSSKDESVPLVEEKKSYGSFVGSSIKRASLRMHHSLEMIKVALCVEFCGTMIYTVIVGCTFATLSTPMWGATAQSGGLMVMSFVFARISGAHFNPAISLSAVLVGDLSSAKLWMYWAVQLLGGLAGGGFVRLAASPNVLEIRSRDPFTWYDAVELELLFTTLLCFVFLNCVSSKRNNPKSSPNRFSALAIGFVIVAAGYSAGGVSGALLNPVVSLGLGITSGKPVLFSFVFAAAELLAAFLAVGLFKIVRPEEEIETTDEFETDFDAYVSTTAARLSAEAVGTFVLMLTLGVNLLVGSRATPFSVASALMVMIYSLANVSGAHFNPAVTAAAVLCGRCKMTSNEWLQYMAAQTAGATLGGLYTGFLNSSAQSANSPVVLTKGDGFEMWQAALVEMLFTALLAYVLLVASLPLKLGTSKPHPLFGLIIASCVTAGGFAVGGVSGGVFNPALCFGIVMHTIVHRVTGVASSWNAFPTYVTAELVGGMLAAGLFSITHATRQCIESRRGSLLSRRGSQASQTPEDVPETANVTSESRAPEHLP